MAEHLASIFGTEKDRVNCPFYFKIGACRHGDRCSRIHNKPPVSQTILFKNMYQNPVINTPPGKSPPRPAEVQQHYEDFYEDVFEELAKFGEVTALKICDNLADHLIGNVYASFREESEAQAAMNAINGRLYAGRPIVAEFSPVTDFREATCRQYDENNCNRGGYCNFMHLKKIGRDLHKDLFGRYPTRSPERRQRSRSPPRGYRRGGDYDRRDYNRSRYSPDRRPRSRSPPRYRRGYDHRDRDDRYDRYDRYRDDRGRDDRGRDHRGRDDRGRDDRNRDDKGRQETDEERRAKIAEWNREQGVE